MTPPILVQFNASNVPVVQMDIGGDNQSEQQLYDYALNFIRVQLFTILVVPAAYALLRRRPPALHVLDERFEREARGEIDTGVSP